MATFAIIPGGGDSPISWGPACEHLRELGHVAVPVETPATDPEAGWCAYVDAVVAAVRAAPQAAGPLAVVGHSFGGLFAPLVCARLRVDRLILVAAMIPEPGVPATGYWERAGYVDSQFNDDAFYHDLSAEALALAKRSERPQESKPMAEPCPLERWPAVPTHYLLCKNDRVFSAATSRRIVRERLGLEADEIDAGHCVHLARPHELAARLHGYSSAG